MKTPDEIEKEIMEKWRPVTMKQAIHNTIWYMRELIEKEVKDE